MNKLERICNPRIAVVVLLSFLLTSANAATLWYQAVDDERGWDAPSAWHDGGSLPTSGDNVQLSNASIVVPNYLRITNNTEATVSSLSIGYQKMDDDRLVGMKIESGGSLALQPSGTFNLVVGDYGRGFLWIDGGEVSTKAWNLAVGFHTGSYGEIIVGPGSTFTQYSENYQKHMIVGLYGLGKMTTFSDVGYDKMKLRIGGNTQGWNTFLAAGATVTTWDCNVGGVAYYGTDVGVENVLTRLSGYGMLILSNATLRLTGALPGGTVNGQLSLGRYAGSYGVLLGCGVVRGVNADSNTVRVWMDDGQIVADGFGEERELDLNTVVSIGTNAVAATAADTTNGWYAVNKGAALFPRVWFNTGSKTGVAGGDSKATVPGYVNSVLFSISGVAADASLFRGGLFSADRSDVYADSLPDGLTVVGIWKFGVTTTVSGTVNRSYSSVDLDFRYDQSKVRPGDKIALYRWNGSIWEKLSEKTSDSTHRIAASGLAAPASYDGIYNVGTFAVVEKSSGLMILVR